MEHPSRVFSYRHQNQKWSKEWIWNPKDKSKVSSKLPMDRVPWPIKHSSLEALCFTTTTPLCRLKPQSTWTFQRPSHCSRPSLVHLLLPVLWSTSKSPTVAPFLMPRTKLQSESTTVTIDCCTDCYKDAKYTIRLWSHTPKFSKWRWTIVEFNFTLPLLSAKFKVTS